MSRLDRMTHETSLNTMVHLGTGGRIRGSAQMDETDYSGGPYAVVKLALGHMEVTIFPGARVGELVQALRKAAEDLESHREVWEVLVMED